MATTFTTVYSFDKPANGDTGWGGIRNTNMEDIDSELARPRIVHNSPTVGATTTCDLSLARVFIFTVSQATTLAFSNVPTSSFAVHVRLVVTNGSAFVLTFPASVVWLAGAAPILKTSGVDVIELVTKDGGTTWYAALANGDPMPLRNNVDAGTGANTTEVTLHTIPIPAGAMGLNGVLDITVLFTATGAAGATKNVRLKLGATTFCSGILGTGAFSGMLQSTISNLNNVAIQRSHGIRPTSAGAVEFNGATGAINTAIAQNVTVTGETSNAADEITIHSTVVRIHPG